MRRNSNLISGVAHAYEAKNHSTTPDYSDSIDLASWRDAVCALSIFSVTTSAVTFTLQESDDDSTFTDRSESFEVAVTSTSHSRSVAINAQDTKRYVRLKATTANSWIGAACWVPMLPVGHERPSGFAFDAETT